MTRLGVIGWLLAAGLLLGSCGGKSAPAEGPPKLVKTCTKAGQRCEVAPGKVGLCSITKSGGLTCASQH